MNARCSLLLSALLVFFTSHAVDAQQPAKVPTLGYLSQFSGAAGPRSALLEAFLQGLTENGYVEGKNIAIEYRYTEGKNDRLPALAAELVSRQVEIIVAETGGAALEAKKATQTIPIVMEGSGDAVGLGNVQLHSLVARDPAGLPAAFAEAKRQQVQAIIQFNVPSFTTAPATAQSLEFALANRVPMMFRIPIIVQQGGLIAYGADSVELSRRAAGYVDRILKGAKAGDLPVGTPEKFLLLVNLKTAKAIGLTIPPSILSKADTVIE